VTESWIWRQVMAMLTALIERRTRRLHRGFRRLLSISLAKRLEDVCGRAVARFEFVRVQPDDQLGSSPPSWETLPTLTTRPNSSLRWEA